MKKDDVVKMLRDSANLVESSELTHTRIAQLWVSANCIKQHIEDMIRLRNLKTTDNEQN
jgi:hypothetical protein